MNFTKGEVIAINKPLDMTSFSALAYVRKRLCMRLGVKNLRWAMPEHSILLQLVCLCYVQASLQSALRNFSSTARNIQPHCSLVQQHRVMIWSIQ